VDAAAWARTDDDARAIVAAAFQQRRVTTAQLDAVLTSLPHGPRRGLVRETAALAARGAEAVSRNWTFSAWRSDAAISGVGDPA
jgi:hypothetical protein